MLGVRAQSQLDRGCLVAIILRRAGSVGIDIIDVSRTNTSLGHGAPEGGGHFNSVRFETGHVISVGLASAAVEVSVDSSTSVARVTPVFQNEHRSPLS